MIFEKLANDAEISQFLCNECSENNAAVEFNENLIYYQDYVVLKVDDYYNSLNLAETPASPDCLIIVKCQEENHYRIYIVELKDIANQRGFNIKNMREKFKTCVNDFMKGVLHDFLSEEQYVFEEIALYFVSDPYNENQNGSRVSKNKATKMDSLLALNTTPYIYDGKRLSIQHRITNPVIMPC